MNEEQILLSEHFEFRNEQSGPKFGELQQKLETEKNSGWGAQIVGLLRSRKKFLAKTVLTLSFVGGFFAVGIVGTEGLPANLNEVKNVLYSEESTSEPEELLEEYSANTEIGESITVTAEAGEGVTHLARRAVEKYLENEGIELSAEQKVYTEDYLKRIEGNYSLSLGQEVTFSTKDIKQAVENAENLEEWQLQNLEQYTQNVQI